MLHLARLDHTLALWLEKSSLGYQVETMISLAASRSARPALLPLHAM